jgi:hypothetical protein
MLGACAGMDRTETDVAAGEITRKRGIAAGPRRPLSTTVIFLFF